MTSESNPKTPLNCKSLLILSQLAVLNASTSGSQVKIVLLLRLFFTAPKKIFGYVRIFSIYDKIKPMNLAIKEFDLKIEQAIRLLTKYVSYDENRKKLIIPHCVKVSFYLQERGYSSDIVLGGLLHDIIEWTESPEQIIKDKFGENVFNIIMANTQNNNIDNKVEKWKDMVNRCVGQSEDALIVKSADVLDSYNYYKK